MTERPESRKRITNSEMAMYKRCPRKWMLGYHMRLGTPDPDFGRPTGLGTRVHDALAKLYDPREPVSDADVINYMRKQVEKDLEKYPAYADDINKEADLAVIMMEGYLQWLAETGSDQHLRVIAPEAHVEVAIESDEVQGLAQEAGYEEGATLLSKLDVRVQSDLDNSRWALEHKTVQNLSDPIPLLQIDAQLLTEHLVEFLQLLAEGRDPLDERADGVYYNMLRKVKRTARAKPPFYDRKEVRHNVEELRSHWLHVTSWATKILEAHIRLDEGQSHHEVCPPVNDRSCAWQCPFFKICPMLDDGSDWRAAAADLYVTVDPLERYSRDSDQEEHSAQGGK